MFKEENTAFNIQCHLILWTYVRGKQKLSIFLRIILHIKKSSTVRGLVTDDEGVKNSEKLHQWTPTLRTPGELCLEESINSSTMLVIPVLLSTESINALVPSMACKINQNSLIKP